MPTLSASLASLFGFHAFRPNQEAIVRGIMEGRDTFTVMPTGGGKSLCYQLPAKLLPGVCVVVSPLISLMKDQVDAAKATGLAACAFNSASGAREREYTRSALQEQSLDLLYVSPERLRLPEFLAFLKTVRIAFFAIDEAHCMSEWGHDFRPDYLALSSLRDDFPGTPVSAFTATATARVAQDIVSRLNLASPLLTRASFNRPNLFYQVTPKENLEKQLVEFLRRHEGESGIIYRTTRKDVEKTVKALNSKGIAATAYHAGLSDQERSAAQDAFRKDIQPLIVATIAFGMGIDKPNVRFVIHGDLPKNLESYYQETGRAGRDGENARCVLFYGRKDIAQLLRFAEGVEDEMAREIARNQVYRMLDFTQKEGCRRKSLLGYFGEELPGDNCGGCDICQGETEREDATEAAQKLLSAIVRTHCRFGAQHSIAIVMGKATPRILACGHDRLPTFGVGADKDKNYWHRIMDALVAQGLVQVADPGLPVPEVTPKGWEVLRGQRPCSIIRLAQNKTKAVAAKKPVGDESPALFQALREERIRLSADLNVPPFVIFSDRSLREMAALMPDTPERFLQITGVGEHKLQAFGEVFITLIADYRANNREEAELADQRAAQGADHSAAGTRAKARRSAAAPDSAEKRKAVKGETLEETMRLLDAGLSVEAVAAERGRTVNTILAHMEKLAASGVAFAPARFMDDERLNALRECFAEAESHYLHPVVEKTRAHPLFAPEGTSFAEARLARLLLGLRENASEPEA